MKTQLSKPARGYARYTDEYKEQALQLWRASGRSAAKVAAELGIRPRIARLMRVERLFARQRSKYRVRTTDSGHGGPIAPNRLQSLTVRRPDQVWVTDATGILTGQGWLYLVAVLDLCSRRVPGWAMHQSLDTRLVSAARRMALLQRRPRTKLILHSDRGNHSPAPPTGNSSANMAWSRP